MYSTAYAESASCVSLHKRLAHRFTWMGPSFFNFTSVILTLKLKVHDSGGWARFAFRQHDIIGFGYYFFQT